MDFLGGISPEGVFDGTYLHVFLRLESSRWNLLGGVLQERFCPMEFNYFLVTRWNSLGGIL